MLNNLSPCGGMAIKETALPGCWEWQSSSFGSPKTDEGVGSASEPHSIVLGEPLPDLDILLTDYIRNVKEYFTTLLLL